MPHTTIRPPTSLATPAPPPRRRTQSLCTPLLVARERDRRLSFDGVAQPRVDAACLRAAWTPYMLAKECFALLQDEPGRRGLLLWCALLADAHLGVLGPLALQVQKSAGASDTLEVTLHADGAAAAHLSLPVPTASGLHRTFTQISETWIDQPLPRALSNRQAIGWLLGEPEHVAAWCQWAGPQTPAQWQALGNAAVARGQRCSKQSLPRRYLREIANQCTHGQNGGPDVLRPTPVTPALASSQAAAAVPRRPTPPAPTAPVLAPGKKKRPGQANKTASSPRGPQEAALVSAWLRAVAQHDKSKSAKLGLVGHALHHASESGASPDSWTDSLWHAGRQDPDLGWQLYREMIFALHKPSTAAVCASLLSLPVPSHEQALRDAAGVLDAVAAQPHITSYLPSDHDILLGYLSTASTRLPVLRVLALHGADRLDSYVRRAIAADTQLPNAIADDALAALAAVGDDTSAETATASLMLLSACAAHLSPAKRLALLQPLDAAAEPHQALEQAVYALLAQQMADLPTIAARGLHTRKAAYRLLTAASPAEIRAVRTTAARSRAPETLSMLVIDQALVEALMRGDDAMAQLRALRTVLRTANQPLERRAQRIDCIAETLLQGLTRLGQCIGTQAPLPTSDFIVLYDWLSELWDDVAPNAERLQLQPTRQAVRDALREGGLDDFIRLGASLPTTGLPPGTQEDRLTFQVLAPLCRLLLRIHAEAGPNAMAARATSWLERPPLRDATAFALLQNLPLPAPRRACHADGRAAPDGPHAELGALAIAHGRHWLLTWLADDDALVTASTADSHDVWYRLAPRLLAMVTLDGYAMFAPAEPCVVRLQQTFAGLPPDAQKAVAAGLRGAFVAADKHAFFRAIGDVSLAQDGPSSFCREHLLPVVVAFCRGASPRLAAHTAHRYIAACGIEAEATRASSTCGAPDAFARRALGLLGAYLLHASALPALAVQPAAPPSADEPPLAWAHRFARLFADVFSAEDGQEAGWQLVEALLVTEQRRGTTDHQTVLPLVTAALRQWLPTRRMPGEDAAHAATAAISEAAVFVCTVIGHASPSLSAGLRRTLPAALQAAAHSAPNDAFVAALAACAPRGFGPRVEQQASFVAQREKLEQRRALVQLRDDTCGQSIASRIGAVRGAAAAEAWHIGPLWAQQEAALVRVVTGATPLAALQTSIASLSTRPHHQAGLQALVRLAEAATQAFAQSSPRP